MTKSVFVAEIPVEKPKVSVAHQDLTSTVGRNTFFGIMSGAAQVGTRLITVPFVIAHLGLAGYGIWSIIMTTAAYMRFGAIGTKSAFQKYVAEATGSGDYDRASALLSTGCAIMMVLSVIGLIPVIIFSTPLARAAGVPPEFLRASSKSIAILALIMTMSNGGAVFEATLLGGHRIDIARRLSTTFTVAEAVAILIVLHFGYGLFAMAAVMAFSEIGFVACCYVSARKVIPQIKVRFKNVQASVLGELLRFAGSYQLVSILQLTYAALLPITILRAFGASYSGIYALSLRLISPAQMLLDAFLLSILSGGAMVYASGATDRMERLLHKSHKVTFAFTFIPMAFIACFGPMIVFAWTGEHAPEFRLALVLVAIGGVFQSVSILGLVLYRISGKALLDNVRQVLMLAVLLVVAIFARSIGFQGVLLGLAVAQLLGMLFMFYAIAQTFHLFRPLSMFLDAARAVAATAVIIIAGLAATFVPLPLMAPRAEAWMRLAVVFTASAVAAVPATLVTGFIDAEERDTLFRALVRVCSFAQGSSTS